MEIHRLVQIKALKRAAFFRFGITRIIKTGTVLRPGDAGKFHPVDFVFENIPARCINNAEGHPVGAALLNLIGDQRSIRRRMIGRQRRRAVIRPAIRIKKDVRLRIAILSVEHILVLKPVIAAVEYPLGLFDGQQKFFVIPQLFKARLDGVTAGQGFQIGEGRLIFRRDPRRHRLILAHIRLKPAERISDAHAKKLVRLADCCSLRIGEFWFWLFHGSGFPHRLALGKEKSRPLFLRGAGFRKFGGATSAAHPNRPVSHGGGARRAEPLPRLFPQQSRAGWRRASP